jgi:hypothetical protein
MTPLEFFTSVMRDPHQPLATRLDAAKAAAPYMHSRLAAVEIAGKPEKPQNEPEPSTLEIARRLAFILATAKEELKEQNSNQRSAVLFRNCGDLLLWRRADMLVRLSRAPVVSIASIRGRATGVGSELALASDMRFASRDA